MNTQLHLIIKAEDGDILETDAKEIIRNWRCELLMFENSISIPVISVKKAKELLETIRSKKYEKAYRYEISKQIFKGKEKKQIVNLIEEGVL